MTDEERGCEDGEVILQGGAGPSNGYVEFCLDRRWGGVCRDGWNINNTKVACSQRGFEPEGTSYDYLAGELFKRIFITNTDAVIIDGPAHAENGPVFLGEVTCKGSEGNLSECGYVLSTDSCTRAAISCWKYSRELLHNQQVLSSNKLSLYNKTGKVRCANETKTSPATIIANQGYTF